MLHTLCGLVLPCDANSVMAKLGSTHTCFLVTVRVAPLGSTHLISLEVVGMGTTLGGRPGICTGSGAAVSSTNSVSRACLSYGKSTAVQPTTLPSAPLVMEHSVASFCLSMIGMPMHRLSLPAWCSDMAGSVFQSSSCSSWLTIFVFLSGFTMHFRIRLGASSEVSLPSISME